MSLRSCVVVALCCSAFACGGDDGEDGKNALTRVVPATADECPAGGWTIQAGQDTNGNGELDPAEITSASSVCDGDDMGGPWLTASADADLATCPWGGTVLSFGKDLDKDEVLAPTEVLSTRAVCNSTVEPNALFATWTGQGSDNRWSNPDNWDLGERPSPGSSLRFPADAAQLVSVNDLQTLHAVNGLDVVGGHAISGNQLTVLGNIYAAQGTNTLALPLHTRSVALIDTPDGAADDELTVSGAITGQGFAKQGTGRARLVGTNTYAQEGFLLVGALAVAGGNALDDTAPFFCDGGTLEVGSDGESIGDLDGSCAIVLEGELVARVTAPSRNYAGAMSGPAAFVKRGNESLVLSGASNDHIGALRVEEGTLRVNASYGASPTTVSSGARLVGTGNVASVTASTGAIIQPGDGVGPGNLVASGNVTLAAGSTLRVALNSTTSGTGYSRLTVLNTIDLGGATLDGTVGFAPVSGNFFDIIQCGALIGTFDGHPNGSTVTLDGRQFTISYTTTAVRLTKT